MPQVHSLATRRRALMRHRSLRRASLPLRHDGDAAAAAQEAQAKQGRLQLRQADTAFEDAMHQIMGRLQSSVAQSA